jgi:hypothetical protein
MNFAQWWPGTKLEMRFWHSIRNGIENQVQFVTSFDVVQISNALKRCMDSEAVVRPRSRVVSQLAASVPSRFMRAIIRHEETKCGVPDSIVLSRVRPQGRSVPSEVWSVPNRGADLGMAVS